jgi:hypothetical protein
MSAPGNQSSAYLSQDFGCGRLREIFRKISNYISAGFEPPSVRPSEARLFFASDMNEDSLTEAEILYLSLIGMGM